MYALDVYYNQTYGTGGNRNDDFSNNFNSGARVDDFAAALPLFYRDYPRYRDPYIDTYRSLERGAGTIDRILRWISLAHET